MLVPLIVHGLSVFGVWPLQDRERGERDQSGQYGESRDEKTNAHRTIPRGLQESSGRAHGPIPRGRVVRAAAKRESRAHPTGGEW